MDLAMVKSYLRVDYDYDDDFITLAMGAAESYLQSAVDDWEKKSKKKNIKSKADIVRLALIQEMYDNRMLINEKSKDLSYTIRSLITQLQYEVI